MVIGSPSSPQPLLFPMPRDLTMLHQYSDRWQPKTVLRIRRPHYYFAIAAACFLWALLILVLWLLPVLIR